MADEAPDFIPEGQFPASQAEPAPDFIPEEQFPSPEKAEPSLIKQGLMAIGKPIKEALPAMERGALKALPGVGGVVGAVGGEIAMPAGGGAVGFVGGSAAGKALEDYLEEKLLGQKKTTQQKIVGPIQEAGTAAAMGLAEKPIAAGAKMVAESPAGQMVKNIGAKFPQYLESMSNVLAKNATGATGKQMLTKFDENAGNEMIKEGIVNYGNSQKAVAQKAYAAMEQSGRGVGNAIKALDKKGVTVDTNDVYSKIANRINELKQNAGTVDQSAKMEKELENFLTSSEAKGWKTNLSIAEAEAEKKSFNNAWKSADPDVRATKKDMYQIWRNTVEEAATKAQPGLAQRFIDEKQAHSLWAPIADAAEQRAATADQHKYAHYVDLLAATAGAESGHPLTGAGLVVGRKFILPRVPATVATGAYDAAQFLKAIPKYGKMATENPEGFKALAQTYADQNQESQPSMGPKKWAQEGYNNLIKHGADLGLMGKVKGDPKYQDMLVKASDLRPGSKAMDNLFQKIQGEK